MPRQFSRIGSPLRIGLDDSSRLRSSDLWRNCIDECRIWSSGRIGGHLGLAPSRYIVWTSTHATWSSGNVFRRDRSVSFQMTKVTSIASTTMARRGHTSVRSRRPSGLANGPMSGCSRLLDGSTAYAGTSISFGDGAASLYEVDLGTAETSGCAPLRKLDRSLQSRNIHAGYDAWDGDGAFYFASFRGRSDEPVILTA